MATIKFVLCSLILLLCISIQAFSASAPYFPSSLIKEMAKRENRYHHYIWHNIREGWNRFSNETKIQITALGWAPPRPGRSYDADGVSSAIPDNNSGEDFLYMHRQMITKANDFLRKNKESFRVSGWTTIPSPSSTSYPVPPVYNITGNPSLTTYSNTRKTNDYYTKTIKPMEESLKDPVKLRNMTLGQFGARIEVTVHSWMHMRFSNKSDYGYRPANKSAVQPNFDKKWDDPRYNWLGDTYASHVHPVFWKLHGWVDDRIEDWRKANNLTSIRWKGTWTGGPMSSFSSVLKKDGAKTSLRVPTQDENHSEEHHDVMEQVLQVLALENGPEVSFGDDVKIDLSFVSSPPKENKPKKALKPKSRTSPRSLCRSRLHRKKN